MDQTGPKTVIVAEGALEKLPVIVSRFGKGMVVTDRLIFEKYKDRLNHVFDDNPVWVLVDEQKIEDVDTTSVDIIIGFGGGRSIDAAKLVAAESGKDWVSVPTAASHDGIASEAASVAHDGYRYSRRCKLPIAVLADLSVIAEAPDELQLAGTGDILCKASSLSEWVYAHEVHGEPFAREAFDLVKQALDSVIADSRLETLIRAEIDAGKAMYLAGSSRPCSGTEHAISHAMERRNHTLHGLQVAFATPLCLHYLESSGYALYSPDFIGEIMGRRGLPRGLSEIGTTEYMLLDDIHHALRIMRKRHRHSILEGVDDNHLRRTIQQVYG